MALYAFDGTGNKGKATDPEGVAKDSNVVDFFRGYIDPEKDDDPDNKTGSLYLNGIGTRAHLFVTEKLAEAFGVGGHKRIRDAIRRLENNFEAEDTTIDIIGFSRGAALAISFANEIGKRFPGILIRFIGVWDTVGEFGAPGRHVNAGHDLGFPANVQHCYHAMAMDESRALFQLTRLTRSGLDSARLQEVWFRGVHSDVGGGNGNACMNWLALNWMFENARRHSLPITAEAVANNIKSGCGPDGKTLAQLISDHKIDLKVERHFLEGDVLHSSVVLNDGPRNTPHNNPPRDKILARIDDAGLIIKAAGSV